MITSRQIRGAVRRTLLPYRKLRWRAPVAYVVSMATLYLLGDIEGGMTEIDDVMNRTKTYIKRSNKNRGAISVHSDRGRGRRGGVALRRGRK